MKPGVDTLLALATVSLLLAACASGTLPPHGPHDPANPEAEETPFAGSSPAVAKPGSAEAEGPYACPMHPEVTSSSPGRCPKCGMQLAPQPRRAP